MKRLLLLVAVLMVPLLAAQADGGHEPADGCLVAAITDAPQLADNEDTWFHDRRVRNSITAGYLLAQFDDGPVLSFKVPDGADGVVVCDDGTVTFSTPVEVIEVDLPNYWADRGYGFNGWRPAS